jgi:peroxiredoxin
VGAAQKIVVAACVIAAGCGGGGARSRPTGPPIDLRIESVDGGEVLLSSYRGRVVVVHVFATWAPAAHADADELIKLHRARSRDVTVIGIALDPEGRRFVAPWKSALDAPYVVGLADDAIRAGQSPLGKIKQVPATFVLDRGGRIARRIERQLQAGEIDSVVADLLRAPW